MELQQMHHIAYRCRDAGETADFYEKMLDLPLAHVIVQDRVPSTQQYDPHCHLFFELADHSYLAFFDVATETEVAQETNPDWAQHIAMELSSEAELISNLGGSGELQGSVTINLKAEEQLGGVALGVLGQKVKEIQAIADATTTLLGAFAGAPARLTGTFVADRGILRTEDTKVIGRNATALTAATVDLPGWRLDSQTNVYRAGDQAAPYLTAAHFVTCDPETGVACRPETPSASIMSNQLILKIVLFPVAFRSATLR